LVYLLPVLLVISVISFLAWNIGTWGAIKFLRLTLRRKMRQHESAGERGILKMAQQSIRFALIATGVMNWIPAMVLDNWKQFQGGICLEGYPFHLWWTALPWVILLRSWAF